MESYGRYLNGAFAPPAPIPVAKIASSDDLHFISSEENTYQDISNNVPPSLRNNDNRSYSSVPPISNNGGTSINRSLMNRPSQQTYPNSGAGNYTTPQPIQTFHQPINSYGNQNANRPAVHTPLESQNGCGLNSGQQLHENFTQYMQTMPLLFSGSTNYLNPHRGTYAQKDSTRAASQRQVPGTSQQAYNSNQLPTRVNASVNDQESFSSRGDSGVSYIQWSVPCDGGPSCPGSFPCSGGPCCPAIVPYTGKPKVVGSFPCNGGPNCPGSFACSGGRNCPENLPCSGGSGCHSHVTNFSKTSSISYDCPTNSMNTHSSSTRQATHAAVGQNNTDVPNQNHLARMEDNRIRVTLAGGEPLFTVPLQTKKINSLASSANSSRGKNKPRKSAQPNQTGNRKHFRKILPALVGNDVQQVNANLLRVTSNSSKTLTAPHIPVENNGIEIIDLEEEFPNQNDDIGVARPYQLPNTIRQEQPFLRNGTGLEILTVERGSNSVVINTGSTTDSNNFIHNSEANLYSHTSGPFQATQIGMNGTNGIFEIFTLESLNLGPMTQNGNIYNNQDNSHILQTSGVAATGNKGLRSTEFLQHSDGATVDNGDVQLDNVGIGTFDLSKEITDTINPGNTRILSPIQQNETLLQFQTAVTRIQNGNFAEENYAVSADEDRPFLNMPNIFDLDSDESNLVIDDKDNNISSPVPKNSAAMGLSEKDIQQDLSLSDSESELEAEDLDQHVINTNNMGQQETTLGNGFHIPPLPNAITGFVIESTSTLKNAITKKHVQQQSGDAGSSQSGSSTFDIKKNPSPASTGAKKNSALTFYAPSVLSLSESGSESEFVETDDGMLRSLHDHSINNSENVTLSKSPSLSSNYHSELTSSTLGISESISSLQTSSATPSMVRVNPVDGGHEVPRSIFSPDPVVEPASPIPKNIEPVPQNAFSCHEHGRIIQANRSTDDRSSKDFQTRKMQDKPEIIVDGVHKGLQEPGNNPLFHQSQQPECSIASTEIPHSGGVLYTAYQTTSTDPVIHDLEDNSEEMSSIVNSALILNSFKHRNSNPNYGLNFDWKTRSNEVQHPSLPIRTENQIDENNAGRLRVSNPNNCCSTSEVVGSGALHTLADVALGTVADSEVTRKITGPHTPLDLTMPRQARPFNVVQNKNESSSKQSTPKNCAMSQNQTEGKNRMTYNFTQGIPKNTPLSQNQTEETRSIRNTNCFKQGIPQNVVVSLQNQENLNSRNLNYFTHGIPQCSTMSQNQNEGTTSNRVTQNVAMFQNQNEGNLVSGKRYNLSQSPSQSRVLPHNQNEANPINRNTNQLKQGIPQTNISIPSSGVIYRPYHASKETNYDNRDGHRHRSSMQQPAGKIHANVRGRGMLPAMKRNSVYPFVQGNPKRNELGPVSSSHRAVNTTNHAQNVPQAVRAGLPLGIKSKPTPTDKVSLTASTSTDLNKLSRTTSCNKTINKRITQARYENQKFPTPVESDNHNGLDKKRRMTVVDEAGSPVVKRIAPLTKPMLSISASSSLPTLQSVKEKFKPLLDHSPRSKQSSTTSTLSRNATRTKNGIKFKRLIDSYRNPEVMQSGRLKRKYQRDLNKVYKLGSDATPASRNRRPGIGVEEMVRIPTGPLERHSKRASGISSASPVKTFNTATSTRVPAETNKLKGK